MGDRHAQFDHQTAQLFLRLDGEQLDSVRALPDALYTFDLQLARAALLYALGHTDAMVELAEAEGSSVSADALAERLALQRPLGWPATPHLYSGDAPVTLTSRVLGCL